MASIKPIAMTEAVMLRIDVPGGPHLVEYSTEQALDLATAIIDCCQRSLLLEADFNERFLRASRARRLLGGQS